MRSVILFFLLIAIALLAPVGMKRLTGGFRIQKMEIDFSSFWETDHAMSPEILALVKQPFHYLDRGSQCYVFESLDKQYVIKFFRFDAPALYRVFFHCLFRQKSLQDDSKLKADRLFESCKLAYERIPEETGLVFIHLNQTAKGLPLIYCQDAIGRSYHLPLDRYRFVIQKKAELFTQVLEKHLNSGDQEEIKKCFNALFKLIQKRIAKAILNTDPNLSRNVGFLEGKAIEIDFGCYRDGSSVDRSLMQIRQMHRFGAQLCSWLKGRAPEWIPYIKGEVKQFQQAKREEDP